MKNVPNCEGGSVDNRPPPTSADLKDELITSLRSFVRLYDQNKDNFQRASEDFAQVVHGFIKKTIRSQFSVVGGVLGTVCGGVAGGVGGALGAVGAATCGKLCGGITAVGATVGFVGSIFGGVAGGGVSGGIGGAVSGAAKAPNTSEHLVWLTVGLAAGGAIGSIFGGKVGAAGGAVGGAVGGGFGAFCGTRFAVLVGSVRRYFRGTKDSQEEKKEIEKLIEKPLHNFTEILNPLVVEVKKIKTVSDKITCRAAARQTARTLAAVTAMEENVRDCLRNKSPAEFFSGLAEVATQSRQITKEMEKTNAEAEKLLDLLIEH